MKTRSRSVGIFYVCYCVGYVSHATGLYLFPPIHKTCNSYSEPTTESFVISPSSRAISSCQSQQVSKMGSSTENRQKDRVASQSGDAEEIGVGEKTKKGGGMPIYARCCTNGKVQRDMYSEHSFIVRALPCPAVSRSRFSFLLRTAKGGGPFPDDHFPEPTVLRGESKNVKFEKPAA